MAPSSLEEYSVIVVREPDHSGVPPFSGPRGERVAIRHIDRKRIPFFRRGQVPEDLKARLGEISGINAKEAILISSGVHRLHICACEHEGLSSNCGSAVLRLSVQADMIYKATGNVSKRKDFVEIWIEDAESGSTIVDPIRVTGLGDCAQ